MDLAELIPLIRRALDGRTPRRLEEEGLIPAAVLMPIFSKERHAHVLFTKRTEQVKTHKGQISFPGGLKDPQDPTLLAAALRECGEEVGMDTSSVEILGQLDDMTTFAAPIAITPFVGVISYPQSFSLNPKEVERLLEVPLAFFLHEPHTRIKWVPRQGKFGVVYYYDYGRDVIWGATARILRHFMELVFRQPAQRR
jgi:8-oxo-dGTP pyrophosphatase MutT (NUDIX family)